LIIKRLVEEVFVYDFLLLVVLVELLMFDLGASQEGDVVLGVIIEGGWKDLLETSIGVVTVLGFRVN